MALERAIEDYGMPRVMAVFVGSNEDFPFFDAPVISADKAESWVWKYAASERTEAENVERERRRKHAEEPIDFDPLRGFEEMADATREIGKLFDSAANDLKPLLKNKAVMQAVGAIGIGLAMSAFRKRR